MKAQNKPLNVTERTILNKQKLIKRLQAEIVDEQVESADRIKKIEFRIEMAKALLSALQK